MAPLESGSSQLFFNSNVIDNTIDIYERSSMAGTKVVPDHSRYSQSPCTNGLDPPPLPGTSYGKQRTSRNGKPCCTYVPEEVQDYWNKIFSEGYQADVCISTDDATKILSHSCILGIRSPVLRTMLEEARVQHGFRHILISGVPSEAVHVFIRFLYSPRFEQDEMKKYALHLLVLSHVFSVQSLKIVCIPLKIRIFLWQLARGRLPSKAQLQSRQGPSNGLCSLCGSLEDVEHIFFSCALPQFLWTALREILRVSWNPICFDDLVHILQEFKAVAHAPKG